MRRPDSNRGQQETLERSEEHTSELLSHHDLVCRLLLEKKKTTRRPVVPGHRLAALPQRFPILHGDPHLAEIQRPPPAQCAPWLAVCGAPPPWHPLSRLL